MLEEYQTLPSEREADLPMDVVGEDNSQPVLSMPVVSVGPLEVPELETVGKLG